jgi:two-component system sensor histidine kinase/response regulator
VHVLMVDDNQDDFFLLTTLIEKIAAIELAHCTSLRSGLAYIESNTVDVLLLDMSLPEGRGLFIFDSVQTQIPTLPIIILSGSDDDTLALEAVRRGAQDYLVKDHINPEVLKRSLHYSVERKRIEQTLAAERNLLRTLIDSMPDFIFVKDTQSRFLMANKAVLDTSGITKPEEIIGKTDFNFFPADIAQSFYDDDQQVIASGQTLFNKEESSIDLQTGQTMWFLTTKMPLRDEHGTITGLLGISRNITRRKLADDKLSQERDLLRTLIDSTPDYIFIKDVAGRFVITNIAHAQAVNATPDELEGKTAFEMFPPDLAAQFHADDERIIQSGTPLINLERTTVGEHGVDKTVLTTKIPLRDLNGRVTGLVGISRDITERKQLEAQSLELSSERERTKILQRFISDMSHDFRTPLTILNTSLYLLKKIVDPQKQQAQMQQMEQQIARLNNLLDELLEMSQLDRQDTGFRFDLTEVNALVSRIVQEYEPTAAAKRIAIQFTPDLTAQMARIDPKEFTRALVNLLANAVAYSPEGGTITVCTQAQPKHTVISVQDNGIGISESDLPHIFERFYRADQARSTTTGGHGLGLSIAQKIIEAHGGSIQVSSTLGQGSTFSIELPVG